MQICQRLGCYYYGQQCWSNCACVLSQQTYEKKSLTEDDVRRIVREELVRSHVVVDRSDDI